VHYAYFAGRKTVTYPGRTPPQSDRRDAPCPAKANFLRKGGEVPHVEVHETLLLRPTGAISSCFAPRRWTCPSTFRKEEEIWQTTAELRAIFQALPDLFLRRDTFRL